MHRLACYLEVEEERYAGEVIGRASRPAIFELISRVLRARPQHVMQNECARVLLRDIQQYIMALHADFEAEAFCCSKIATTVAQLLSFKARADA
eukprot:7922389-Pyramimonas_sp.AAC.1